MPWLVEGVVKMGSAVAGRVRRGQRLEARAMVVVRETRAEMPLGRLDSLSYFATWPGMPW